MTQDHSSNRGGDDACSTLLWGEREMRASTSHLPAPLSLPSIRRRRPLRVAMVSVNVNAGGKKPSINVEFPGKNAGQVTVADLKKGIEAKFPKVSLGWRASFAKLAADTL